MTQDALPLGVVGAVPAVEAKPAPAEQPKRPDFFSLMAAKKFGTPEGWRWYQLEALGELGEKNRARQFSQMTGYVHNGARYKSGKNAGKLRANSPGDGTKRTIVFTMAEHDAFLREWELETGQCHSCAGTPGFEPWGWSVKEGERTKKCARCFGTGKAPP